jgi:hypothetical protein
LWAAGLRVTHGKIYERLPNPGYKMAGRAEVIRASVISVKFWRRDGDVTEMTPMQTTVFMAGDNCGNTADANGKNHYVTEVSVLKIAFVFILLIYA